MILHKYQYVCVNPLDLNVNQTKFVKWKRAALPAFSLPLNDTKMEGLLHIFFGRTKLKEDGIL